MLSPLQHRPSLSLLLTSSSLLLWSATLTLAVGGSDLRLDGRGWSSSSDSEAGGGQPSSSSWDVDPWYVQVDGVMGGLSSGRLEFEDNDTVMYFWGNINLNGGGFSSVRRRFNPPLDLSSYAGIVIELETHKYTDDDDDDDDNSISRTAPLGMHLQLGDRSSRYGFASAFAVPLAEQSGIPTRVFLPMKSFDRASRMGWVCNRNDCVLDPTRINDMDLYVLFQKGRFQVRIHSIYAVEEYISFPSPVITTQMSTTDQVKTLIDSTISNGGGLYDYGYKELCIAIYRSTLNTLLASNGTAVTSEMKTLICDGLEQAAAEGTDVSRKEDVAWSLRGTLDAVLEISDFSGDKVMIISSRTFNASNWVEEEDGGCMAVTSFPPVFTNQTTNTTYYYDSVGKGADTLGREVVMSASAASSLLHGHNLKFSWALNAMNIAALFFFLL